MLKCRDFMQHADALVDNTELSFRERLSLWFHWLICHHCRRYLKQLKLLVRTLGRERPPANDDEVNKVLEHLH